MLKSVGFFIAISIFAANEKEICHTKLFLDGCSVIFDAVSIGA